MQLAGSTVSSDQVPTEPYEQPDQITLQVTPEQAAPDVVLHGHVEERMGAG